MPSTIDKVLNRKEKHSPDPKRAKRKTPTGARSEEARRAAAANVLTDMWDSKNDEMAYVKLLEVNEPFILKTKKRWKARSWVATIYGHKTQGDTLEHLLHFFNDAVEVERHRDFYPSKR